MKITKGDAKAGYGRELQRKSDQHLLEQLQSGKKSTKSGLAYGQSEVNVSLGRLIQNELNAEQLQLERRTKVEKLKELIQAGKYNPSSEAVAESVGKEILLELAHSGSALSEVE